MTLERFIKAQYYAIQNKKEAEQYPAHPVLGKLTLLSVGTK